MQLTEVLTSQEAKKFIEFLNQAVAGAKAQPLKGTDHNNKEQDLSTYKGKYVIVAFYTKGFEFFNNLYQQLNEINSLYKDLLVVECSTKTWYYSLS